jgi:cholesterol oxidase
VRAGSGEEARGSAGLVARLVAAGAPRDEVTPPALAGLVGSLALPEQLDPLTLGAGLPPLLVDPPLSLLAHLGRMLRRGHAVDTAGADVYFSHPERMAFPIMFLHGADNGFLAPQGTAASYERLVARNGARLYVRHVLPGYGHLDCIVGRRAALDVFPRIHAHLERHASG